MQPLITATHSRPVQYLQDHAYRQEAPTPPPIPSSPRGRGLVEPYRPLGPLPPRTVRAVARPGPHPVADGHLVDVAALAAPPYELAAYGLHADGLQAPVHARVPHRRYVGMRGGQVVVAGEHLAARAVRAARVRPAPARSVRYETGPLVTLFALPPDAPVGVGDHIGRLQVAVALPIPFGQKLGMLAREVVETGEYAMARAVRAAQPVGPQVAIALEIPFGHELGMRSSQVVEAAQQLVVLAVRAAVVDAHGAHAHLLAPDVAARSAPPHHGACVGVEVLGAQTAVQLGVELPGDVRPL